MIQVVDKAYEVNFHIVSGNCSIGVVVVVARMVVVMVMFQEHNGGRGSGNN